PATAFPPSLGGTRKITANFGSGRIGRDATGSGTTSPDSSEWSGRIARRKRKDPLEVTRPITFQTDQSAAANDGRNSLRPGCASTDGSPTTGRRWRRKNIRRGDCDAVGHRSRVPGSSHGPYSGVG